MTTTGEPPVEVTYLDTSAAVKLVVAEHETAALRGWMQQRIDQDPAAPFVTSTLTGVELRRAARRHGSAALAAAERVLAGLHQVAMTPDLLSGAGMLEPPTFRSLDAIHLSTALRIGRSLAAFVVYDTRLAAAAAGAGITVVQPGRTPG